MPVMQPYIRQQLLAFSFLKVEEINSERLGRFKSLFDKLRTGLLRLGGVGLDRHSEDAERNMLCTLFSDVKAEHSR